MLVLLENLTLAAVYDFSKNDQGFASMAVGPEVDGAEFVYGDGRWSADGGEAGSDQFLQAVLGSPTVSLGGEVFVRITHRYDFEPEWDSGHLLISINGGPDQVAGEEVGVFLENGYGPTISDQSSNPRSGSAAWTGKSSERVTSLVGLGELRPGTSVAIKLVATWDAGTVATTPNWEVFEVAVVSGNEYRTWVVDNDRNNAAADFHGIDAAIAGAGSGDVLLVMPSAILYGDTTVTKRLTIVGPGFGGPELRTRFQAGSAMLGRVRIEEGVHGVTLMGLDITGGLQFGGSRDYIGIANTLLLRNRIHGMSVFGYGEISEAFFINNWITGKIKLVQRSTHLEFFRCRSAYFLNNVIRGAVDLYDAWNNSSGWHSSVSQVVFANNIFDNAKTHIDLHNGAFYNNILHREPEIDRDSFRFDPRQMQLDHNVFFGAFPSKADGDVNTFVKPATEVLRWDESPWFQQFELAEDSPAIDAGRDGGEAGIFGGLYPWDRDQAPPIPFVTKVEAPHVVGQGESLRFRVELKSNQ